MLQRPVHFLLVEDDEVDAEAMLRSFRRMGTDKWLTIFSNGERALKALKGEGGYARLPRPYVIILDLNMPSMNGIEFLQALRGDKELRLSIVFVLTTSDRDADKIAAYGLHVAGYFLKTRYEHATDDVLTLLVNYCRLVEFPSDAIQEESP